MKKILHAKLLKMLENSAPGSVERQNAASQLQGRSGLMKVEANLATGLKAEKPLESRQPKI